MALEKSGTETGGALKGSVRSGTVGRRSPTYCRSSTMTCAVGREHTCVVAASRPDAEDLRRVGGHVQQEGALRGDVEQTVARGRQPGSVHANVVAAQGIARAVHAGDFQLRQFAMSPSKLTVLDWDDFSLGDPGFDVSYFKFYKINITQLVTQLTAKCYVSFPFVY